MDCINGEMELYLSAETQRYEAPIIKANVIGKESSFHQNIIDNLTFVKGESLKISLELDYSDYCSMEVILRATSK